ncbi:NADAR family protein [Vibrio alginolyticus]|uniref:NADAR family protein n=1 Tax=Vibrio alginolyticus TaxID=663 RepID=UPI0011ED5481|nr:NADAR family protein [Vibrio alginolyticus]ELB2808746.1 NADAR family protein [Vibrio alginolyticus]MCR9562870.1 NADAR family protein [Vibrio alginolyticus]MCS0151665.1 NADAR family protein [Vibrio alginolyticus]TYZ35486.1 NADAR family protein [Vibrio alginolyticus]
MAVEVKQYDIKNAAAFKKTTEKWGELSNMCAGFPIVVNNIPIKSAEALYQACRFPHHPDIQKKILEQNSPMTAKMVGKPHLGKTREDWEQVRILIMKWVLRVKLAQNMERFSSVLRETQDMPIVELSNKDDFWGAKPVGENIYVGVNALGRLLMELRDQLALCGKSPFLSVAPLKINNFLLYGNAIEFVYASQAYSEDKPQIDFFD